MYNVILIRCYLTIKDIYYLYYYAFFSQLSIADTPRILFYKILL